ncbi:molybdopterin converting factor subunit 1 [Teredinibacter franksiae]|uniref:molybdopterin converting factor subunit 1 n=1 Tax=Teredinibacter franksiae TaxID=2761453 RepID=UPI0016299379|nr:molybdopterin converting factor subunit 1 [Teredinibacter franksiae]
MTEQTQDISILYFASLGEQLGTEKEQYPLSPNCTTIAELIQALAARGDIWSEALNASTVKCAVNHTLCNHTAALKPTDEVAFFPPVTGG